MPLLGADVIFKTAKMLESSNILNMALDIVT